MIRRLKVIISKVIKFIYHCLYRFIKVDEDLVIFISFHGKGYSDNPKAIYEYMISNPQYANYKYIWFIKNKNKSNISLKNAKIVEYFSFSYFYYMSKAKYWVINCKMPSYISKKENQVYLQTWHGIPLKRLGHDIVENSNTNYYRSKITFKQMIETYDVDSKRYDYMISPNKFTTEVFSSAFNLKKEKLVEVGYPRNDYLFQCSDKEKTFLKEKLGIPLNKKVVLYAPTWRDNEFNAKGYNFKLKVDFTKWEEYLGDEYVVIFKPHYLIADTFGDYNHEFVYKINSNFDISKLYVISDVLITDYSSVFFDFSILNKPIYFYMYDIEDYRDNLRGFYLDIYKDLPGDIYENEEEMLRRIRLEEFDFDRLQSFNNRFNYNESGESSKNICEMVFK